jgi:hypothetical protein
MQSAFLLGVRGPVTALEQRDMRFTVDAYVLEMLLTSSPAVPKR